MSVVIDGYTIDAALRETHSREAELSDYPVEEGADVTDNVRARPKSVEIEGIVSDTPIGTMATLRGGAVGSASTDGELLFLPSEEALAKLEAIFAARAPVTVETSAKTYENMVLVSLEVPRDIMTGEALRFTASFREIILVQVNRTTVRVSAPSGAAKRAAGMHAARALAKDVAPFVDYVTDALTPFADNAAQWDSKGRVFRDKDGNALFSSENTFYDPAQSKWVNKDGTPVTQADIGSTAFDTSVTGSVSDNAAPWWNR